MNGSVKRKIIEELEMQNIHVKSDDLLTMGLVLNVLSSGEKLEKSVCMRRDYNPLNPEQETKYDYIFSFINDSLDELMGKEDVITSEYLTKSCGFPMVVNIYEVDNTKIILIKGKNRAMGDFVIKKTVHVIAGLLPRLANGLIDVKTIGKKVNWLKEVAKSDSTKAFEMALAASTFDVEKLEVQIQKDAIIHGLQIMNKQRRKTAANRIDERNRENESFMQEYRRNIEANNYDMLILSGIENEAGTNERDKELIDFLVGNQLIKNIQTRGTEVFYDVVAPIVYFDQDGFQKATEDLDRVCIYGGMHNDKKKAAKWLLDEIFVNYKYKIMGSATFAITFDVQSYMRNVSDEHRLREDYEGLPAPHAAMYKCNGGFEMLWNQAMENGDLISAIQATISLTQNINWLDPTVAMRFLDEIMACECIMDESGELHSGRYIIENFYKEESNE
ncbi:hypothetical protein M2140_000087 [Clostridiales Family XIII bacterium PM5-7]